MDLHLDDKTVLITGAAGGIGHALAMAFAAEGCRLVLLAHTQLDTLRERWGERALCLGVDVTHRHELDAAWLSAEEQVGRIDIAVANAGIWPPEAARLDQMEEERVRRVLEVNLLGAFWTARAWQAGLARHPGQGAALCLIGSTAGRFGEAGHAPYAVSKAALHGLMRSLKNEVVALDPTARVNLVEPGWTATPMAAPALAVPGAVESATRTAPLSKVATPEDVAHAVVFLCSPAAGHLTGEVLTVAGGMEGRVLR